MAVEGFSAVETAKTVAADGGFIMDPSHRRKSVFKRDLAPGLMIMLSSDVPFSTETAPIPLSHLNPKAQG